VHTTEGMLLR